VIPRLHAITNDHILNLPDLDERLHAIVAAGPVGLHLRGRRTSGRRLAEIGRRLVDEGVSLLVNDRVDLVPYIGAVGVHLPATGLPTADVRRLLGSEVVIGRSTHDPDEAKDASAAGADFVFLGPIWNTRSHPDHPGLGTSAIRDAQPATVIAIGGVTPDRVTACLEQGAYGVAVITALWEAADPRSVAAQMLVSLGETHS